MEMSDWRRPRQRRARHQTAAERRRRHPAGEPIGLKGKDAGGRHDGPAEAAGLKGGGAEGSEGGQEGLGRNDSPGCQSRRGRHEEGRRRANPTSGAAGGSITPSNAHARSASRGRAMTRGGDPAGGAAGGMPSKVRPSSARRTRRASAEGEDKTPSRARQMLETPLEAVEDGETPSHARRHGAETSRRTSRHLKPEVRVLQYNRKARFT